jgi:hypothetical protein
MTASGLPVIGSNSCKPSEAVGYVLLPSQRSFLLALSSYVVGYFTLGTLGQVGMGNIDPPFVWRLFNSRILANIYAPAAKVESLLTNKRIQTTSPNR